MPSIKAIVFDLYGTLYDVHSVMTLCDKMHPGRGEAMSRLWRQKQLEYTWMRSLMGQYVSFEKATADALRFTCKQFGLTLAEDAELALCDEYLRLKPYPEMPAALDNLRTLGLPLAILSNGSTHSIRNVVANSGLTKLFDHLISVDEVQVFKPHRSVYQLAVNRLDLAKENILFVSSNAWDATGARYFGYPVCWINRGGNVFDELGQQPDFVAGDLNGLVDLIQAGGKND